MLRIREEFRLNKKAYLLIIMMLLMVLSACANTSANSTDDVKIMRLANVVSDDRSLSKAFYKFKEIVEEETKGSIQVEVFTNAILGGDRQIFEGLQLNTIQGATMSTGPISQFEKHFTIFDLPFLFPDENSAYKVLDGPIGQELLDKLPEQNIIGLNYWENGYRQLTNNVRPIETLEDLQSLNIRTLENAMHLKTWNTLGANPTPMNYGELYVGLEQGTVDGQENPVGNVVNSNFYEVQDYLTKTNHIYNASPFIISKPFWDSLTGEEQEIVASAADEVMEYQREVNRQESEEGYNLLEKKGMEIIEISEEEREKFREAVEPVYDNYRQNFGGDLLDQILSEID